MGFSQQSVKLSNFMLVDLQPKRLGRSDFQMSLYVLKEPKQPNLKTQRFHRKIKRDTRGKNSNQIKELKFKTWKHRGQLLL